MQIALLPNKALKYVGCRAPVDLHSKFGKALPGLEYRLWQVPLSQTMHSSTKRQFLQTLQRTSLSLQSIAAANFHSEL